MVYAVFVGCSKMGTHGTIMAGNDHTASASRVSVDDLVFGMYTFFLAGRGEDLGSFVATNATNVPY